MKEVEERSGAGPEQAARDEPPAKGLTPFRQVLPRAHPMKLDVALYPINIRALGMNRVVVEPQDVADLIE